MSSAEPAHHAAILTLLRQAFTEADLVATAWLHSES